MTDLIKRLEDTKLRVSCCPTDSENIEEAIKYLIQYAEVRKILQEKVRYDWNKDHSEYNWGDLPDSYYLQRLLDVCKE